MTDTYTIDGSRIRVEALLNHRLGLVSISYASMRHDHYLGLEAARALAVALLEAADAAEKATARAALAGELSREEEA